jgi:hypothetical protein
MNSNLKVFKKKFKFGSNWDSTKESEHDKNEFEKWKAYKEAMIFEEAEIGAKGAILPCLP